MDLKSSVLKTIIRSRGLGIGKSRSDIRNKKMRSFITNIVLIIALILSTANANAQSNDNFKKLQEISLDQIHQKKSKTKTSQRQNQQEISVNDSYMVR